MTIVARLENFHYPILHNAKSPLKKKRKIVECEANKSLADKKSYAVGVPPKAGLQVGRKPFWDHGITTTKMSPNCFHSKKITTPPTG